MERAEVVLPATAKWREDAEAAFEALGHGSKVKCAEAVDCAPALISRLLGGEVDVSEKVGPISDWLGIPRPPFRLLSTAELVTKFEGMDEDDRETILRVVRQLDKKR